jgi:hypothetical protein
MFVASSFSFVVLLVSLGLFLATIGAVDLGYRRGKRRALKNPQAASEKVDAVQTTVFSLLSLILAFVFSGAASRFDHRQELVIQEANAISSSYMRVDLLPAESQPEIRGLYRRYLESRIALLRNFQDEGEKSTAFVDSESLQREIWKKVSAAAMLGGNTAVISLVHASLNEMIDSTATSLHASRMHPPTIFYGVLFGFILAAGFLVGSAMSAGGERPWLHIVIFSLVFAATMYVILDFEYPRFGIVRIEAADQSLVDVLESMR